MLPAPMRLLPLLAALACASACIVEAPTSGASAAPARAAAAAGAAAPRLTLRGGANFDGKLELVGAEVQPGQLVPGQAARVSLRFRVLEPLTRDYALFVHVEDVDGRVPRFNLDHAPSAGPTRTWQKGQTVTDDFALTLPGETEVRGVNVWLGFWHQDTDTRLALRNPEAVRNDGTDRILLAQLPVAP